VNILWPRMWPAKSKNRFRAGSQVDLLALGPDWATSPRNCAAGGGWTRSEPPGRSSPASTRTAAVTPANAAGTRFLAGRVVGMTAAIIARPMLNRHGADGAVRNNGAMSDGEPAVR
jgi:hypothetical protein